MNIGHIKAARVENSPRLQRLLAFLTKRGEKGATTRQIIHEANVCCVNTAVAELRANNYRINCVYVRETKSGARIYRYRLDPNRTILW